MMWEYGKVLVGTPLRTMINEIRSIKVDRLFYRVSVTEKETNPFLWLEDEYPQTEGSEDETNSTIPSEWMEEGGSDGEWYVEESVF